MSTTPEAFADVKQEGLPIEEVFADKEQETSPESQPETKPEEEKPVVGESTPDSTTTEDNLPFHKHPRWIQREQELEELRARDAQREQELAALRTQKTEEPSDIPDWFVELYGDNQVAWQKYSEHQAQEAERIAQEAIQKLEQKAQEEIAETQKWNGWVEENLKKLSESGKQFDRNELIKVMLDYRPTDLNNNFDFEAGYRIYETLKARPAADPAKSHARKQIADTTSATTGDKKSKDYMTSADLRNKSWNQL